MAEGESAGSWWGGWLEAAKQKSVNAVEFLKKDIQEFTNVMQEDTSKVAEDVKSKLTQENATAATQKVKEGVTKVLGGITKALVIETQDDKHSKRGRKPTGEPIFDRAKARLRAIQLDPGTYCDEPDGSLEMFNDWVKTFDTDAKKGDISELLVANADVRSIYTQMVPSEVSHRLFWQRYFYRIYQLEQDEARKAALMKRADDAQEQLDMDWDDDEWGDIDGPSSPPKGAAGNLQAAMETKKEVCDLEDNAESLEIISLPEEPEELRVPENGTPVVENTVQMPINITEDKLKENSSGEAMNNAKEELEQATKSSGIQNIKKDIENDDIKTTLMLENQVKPHINTAESDIPPADRPTVEKTVIVQTESKLANMQVHEPAPQNEPVPIEPTASVEESISKTLSSIMQPLSVQTDIKTKDKGDMVVVGSEHTTPSSDSTTNKAESTSLGDDWEKDFEDDDLEVTEEDMKLAAQASKKLAETGNISDDGDDDWENWE